MIRTSLLGLLDYELTLAETKEENGGRKKRRLLKVALGVGNRNVGFASMRYIFLRLLESSTLFLLENLLSIKCTYTL